MIFQYSLSPESYVFVCVSTDDVSCVQQRQTTGDVRSQQPRRHLQRSVLSTGRTPAPVYYKRSYMRRSSSAVVRAFRFPQRARPSCSCYHQCRDVSVKRSMPRRRCAHDHICFPHKFPKPVRREYHGFVASKSTKALE